jgi:hypothetical protein
MMAAKLEDLARHRETRRKPPESKRRTATSTGKAGGRGCPICGARPVARYRPFCSVRCADIDLGRWLNESYRVPVDPADAPGEPEDPERD